jgi:hypothetical protein
MLELPVTMRVPNKDELPLNDDVLQKLEKRKHANITEGYTFKYNDQSEDYLPFSFYAEININNSRLWDLFSALANSMPNRVNCIYNFYGEETIVGEYMEKTDIFQQLEKYKPELTQDCNLEFGLLFHVEYVLEEISVSETKYIRFWGSHEIAFRDIMTEFGLSEIPDLEFADGYPTVIEPLSKFQENVKPSREVIEELNKFFVKENAE